MDFAFKISEIGIENSTLTLRLALRDLMKELTWDFDFESSEIGSDNLTWTLASRTLI